MIGRNEAADPRVTDTVISPDTSNELGLIDGLSRRFVIRDRGNRAERENAGNQNGEQFAHLRASCV